MYKSFFSLLFLTTSALAQTHLYQITKLPVLPNQSFTFPLAINASGTVVGYSGSHAFSYASCHINDIGLLPGGASAAATAINNDGSIAGYAVGSDKATHAVSWHDGSIHLLEPGTVYRSEALAINGPGKVAGYQFNGQVAYATAFVDDLPVVVPSDDDPVYSWAAVEVVTGINSSNQLTGYRPIYNNLNQFIAMIGLVTPAGSTSWTRVTPPTGYGPYVYPWAINEGGAVAGWSFNNGTIPRAFLSTNPASAARNLGTLGGTSSQAFGLNNARWVVGTSTTATGTSAAFLFDGTTMINLNTTLVGGAGWVLTEATAINDYNQIVGYGYYNGTFGGFLLTPVTSRIVYTPLCSVLVP